MVLESLSDRRAYFTDDGDKALLGKTTTSKAQPDGQLQLLLEREVVGFFDRSYAETFDSASFSPVFLVVDEDSVHIRQGQKLMTKGHVFEVKNIESDGTGFTQLLLYWLGRYVISLAWGYGESYGTYRYGERGAAFDLDNPPLSYPFTVEGIYDTRSRLSNLAV